MRTTTTQSLLMMIAEAELAAHCLSLAEQSGYSVTRYSELSAARSALESKLPEAVVVDLDMANRDGWALIKTLRGNDHEIDFPWIIGLQETLGVTEVDAAMAAGVNDIVSKQGGLTAFEKALLEADCVHHERKFNGGA